MPYINGAFRLPERTPSTGPDPLATTHARLSIYLWNVLAYRYDGDEHSATRWQKRAWEAAGYLRHMLNPTEAASAVSDAARQAKRNFAQESGRDSRAGAPGEAWSRASAKSLYANKPFTTAGFLATSRRSHCGTNMRGKPARLKMLAQDIGPIW